MQAHGGVEGGRSHGGTFLGMSRGTRGMTNRDRAGGCRDSGIAKEPQRLDVTEGPGDQGVAEGTSGRGEDRVPEELRQSNKGLS